MKKIFQGRYLFHVHTTRTDGHVTVNDYFEYATESGYEQLIFLEHIRREPTYDVEEFVAEIQQAGSRYPVQPFIGFEAKILPGGQLDIRDEHARFASVIGIAEHGVAPAKPESLFDQVLDHELARFSRQSLVWVHPGLWLTRDIRLLDKNPFIWPMIKRAVASGVLIEINWRYGRLPTSFAERIDVNHLVYGCDAHRLKDLAKYTPTFKPIGANRSQ